MSGRLEELTERIAVAVEKMAADPEIEIESGPPICPNCGAMNPDVQVPSQEAGRGPLASIAIEAICLRCSKVMFVVIDSYSMHSHRDTAVAEMEERSKVFET